MKKVGYRFKPSHAELPSGWRDLRAHARGLMIELWIMSDGGVINTIDADPVERAVRDLDYPHRRDRQAANAGIKALVKQGWIEIRPDGLRVLETRNRAAAGREQVTSVRLPTTTPPLTGREQQAKPLESFNAPNTDQNRIDQIRERDHARAREPSKVERQNPEPAPSFVPARRPLPEPPPDIKPAEVQSPSSFVEQYRLAEWLEERTRVRGREVFGFSPTILRRHSLQLAAFALDGQQLSDWKQETAQDLALAVLEGWLVAPKLPNGKHPPFAYASGTPEDYLGAIRKKIAAQSARRAPDTEVAPIHYEPSSPEEHERQMAETRRVYAKYQESMREVMAQRAAARAANA